MGQISKTREKKSDAKEDSKIKMNRKQMKDDQNMNSCSD